MDNIKQVVKDVRFLIATNCCDETIQARIEIFINEHEQALHQPLVISSVCHHNGTYTTVTDSNGNEVCCKCRKPLAK